MCEESAAGGAKRQLTMIWYVEVLCVVLLFASLQPSLPNLTSSRVRLLRGYSREVGTEAMISLGLMGERSA